MVVLVNGNGNVGRSLLLDSNNRHTESFTWQAFTWVTDLSPGVCCACASAAVRLLLRNMWRLCEKHRWKC
ncbi:hypothetical protein BJX76DRAFT_117526 [Aspergillus varians]